jgi:uncharacterized protein (DUF302 family)
MKHSIIGGIVGAILALIAVVVMMPKLIMAEYSSPYNFQQTVDKIVANAKAKNWVVPSISRLDTSIKKHGGKEILPVALVNLCHPHHAHSILKNDSDKKVSIFMPCTISVYDKKDGKTYITALNAELLGNMFGGNVATVMNEVAKDQMQFINFTQK